MVLDLSSSSINSDDLLIDSKFEVDKVLDIDTKGLIFDLVNIDLREEFIQFKLFQNFSIELHESLIICFFAKGYPSPIELKHTVQAFKVSSYRIRLNGSLDKQKLAFLQKTHKIFDDLPEDEVHQGVDLRADFMIVPGSISMLDFDKKILVHGMNLLTELKELSDVFWEKLRNLSHHIVKRHKPHQVVYLYLKFLLSRGELTLIISLIAEFDPELFSITDSLKDIHHIHVVKDNVHIFLFYLGVEIGADLHESFYNLLHYLCVSFSIYFDEFDDPGEIQ